MPSEFEREVIEGYRARSPSIAQSAPDFAHERLPCTPPDVTAFHQSLPEMGYFGIEKDPFNEERFLNNSLPDLHFSESNIYKADKKKAARDIEPVPLQDIRIPARGSLKGEGEVIPMKKVASTFDDMQVSSSSSGRSSSGKISKDLMECLEKMTYHSIADDNPFEPIPLTPQQEKEHASKRVSAVDVAAGLFLNPMVDDSERDEFAEG